MLAEQIDLMKEQLPKVREAVEVLKEVMETDINILYVALPSDGLDDYAGLEDEVAEGRDLAPPGRNRCWPPRGRSIPYDLSFVLRCYG